MKIAFPTGFGRVDLDVRQALATIYGINPKAPMFGTDLPSTRSPRPYRDQDLLLFYEALGEKGAAMVSAKTQSSSMTQACRSPSDFPSAAQKRFE